MRLSKSAFTFFLFCTPLNATTIMLVYGPDYVVIAADSKITTANGKMAGMSCKIHVTPNYVWTSDGLISETDGSFNLEKLVPDAMQDGIPFPASVDRLASRVNSAFPGLLRDYLKASRPPHRGAVVEVILANVRTTGRLSTVRVSPNGLERMNCPGDKACRKSNVWTFGERGAITPILNTSPNIFEALGGFPALNYLIGEQEKATPEDTGGDVAMIIIDSKGPRWIQKGPCENSISNK